MMWIRLGAAVLNQTPLAWDDNRDHILAAIEQARFQGVGLLCLPEMSITGYGCQDAFQSPSVQRRALDVLVDEILPATAGMVVCVGLPLAYRNSLFNAVALLVNGAIVGFVCKRFLAGDGVRLVAQPFLRGPGRGEQPRDLLGRGRGRVVRQPVILATHRGELGL